MVGLSIQYYLSFTLIISGVTTLPNLFNQKILGKEFKKKRRKYLAKDGVTIRDKEQLFYYEVYRSVIQQRTHLSFLQEGNIQESTI